MLLTKGVMFLQNFLKEMAQETIETLHLKALALHIKLVLYYVAS